jgi:UDP-arabinose 4-epimerase
LKVLVTGGAGYIGSHTCKLLKRSGHDPVVFDNLSTGHRALVRFGPMHHGDINDSNALRKVFAAEKPDAVIHFAASAYVGESMRIPRSYYRNNISGTLNLLDAMADAGIKKLVFSSSCATYGVPSVIPIREDSPQSPINPYGESKLFGETMMKAMAATGDLDCIALRYFNASGADPEGEIGEMHDPETHIIPLVLSAIAGHNKNFSILGNDYDTPDGTCIRDYLHVNDLASAHLLALEALTGAPGFDTFNLGTGRGLSVREIVLAAERVTGKGLNAIVGPRRPGDPPSLVADPAKAQKDLGWTPKHSDIDTIISTAWLWMNASNNPFHVMGTYQPTS